MAKVLALIAAIALHALIIMALLFGVRLPRPAPAPAPPMQARLVSPAAPVAATPAVPVEAAPATPRPPKPAPTPKSEKPAPTPSPRKVTPPRPEPKPVPEPEKPKVVHKPVEKPVARPKPEKKPLPVKPPKEDASAARQRALQAQLAEKARAEAVQHETARARAERLRADMAADELHRRLDREPSATTPTPKRDEDVSAIIGRYKSQIRDRVRRYWSSDALKPGLSTAVRVRLDPSGNVLTVRTVRSSGSHEFDQAVEAAVMRASPLPIPSRPDLYQEFREIDFTFSAKDFDNA